jgi:hypothetical protein
MKPAIENPDRCVKCGHLRAEHGAQYPRPCERLDYTWRCKCASFWHPPVAGAPEPIRFTFQKLTPQEEQQGREIMALLEKGID